MKKTLTILAIALTMTVFAQVPTNGLIGSWSFTGNANDQSGNNLNGTVTGATLTTDRFGNTNSAYLFNGTTDYISVADSSLLDFSINNKITISVWVKTQSLTPSFGYVFLSKQSGLGSTQQGFNSAVSSQDLTFIAKNGTGAPQNINFTSSLSVLDNSWHNVVFTFKNDTSDVYIDGVFKNRTIVANSILGSNTQNLLFGKANWVYPINTKQFVGNLDDIRIYNRAVTPVEVSALYNEGLCYTNITVTDTLLITTGITGFSPVTYQNTIKVYPNPSHDHITIDNGNISNLTGYQIKISNSLGQQVFLSAITQQQFYIDITTWGGNGLYFVNTINAQGVTIDTKKIILQ